MKTLFFLGLILLFSCGKQGNKKSYPINQTALSKFVNTKSIPQSPNLSVEKSIINTSYPIEIALYEDGRFYYDLPRLGDGVGTWKLKDGKIQLKAKRTLFDMHIDVLGSDESVDNVRIQFSDRFGPNTLEMTNVNL